MTTQQYCYSLQPPLRPQNGHTLRVLLPGRVSCPRPGKQDKRSLVDQEDIQRRWLAQHTDLPVDVTVVAGSGSGEILDREEYQRLLDLIVSGGYDLVLTEDLGRIVRRVHAFYVCELCEDHAVRLIAINNHGVDTMQPGWRDAAFFASYFYEKDNRDKSLRIKERLRSRFIAGGALPGPIFGIIKPEGAKSDTDLQKDPEAEPIYREWFRRLDEEEQSYSEIADWLNSEGVPTGPSCRGKTKWDCRLVSRTTHNWLLKGIRFRNKRKSRRINASGKYKSEKAPAEELLIRRVPHVAFFDEVYYDCVVAAADARNKKYRRNGDGEPDPLVNRTKKRTRFPGQMIKCALCGYGYVFGGHGQTDHLMCNGAREYACWNGITVDGPLAAEKISEAVCDEIEALEGFDDAFLEMVAEQASQANKGREVKRRSLTTEIARNERELANVAEFIREGSRSPTIRADLERLEHEQSQLKFSLSKLENQPADDPVIPTAEQLRQLAREEFKTLALDSFEFASLMRGLIPKILVFPYRLCDGGQIVLRARFHLRLGNLLTDPRAREVLSRPLERIMTVDLFDPCQREAFREQIVALRAAINPETGKKHTEAEAARQVGITKTAAQRAAALQRQMDQLGLSDPYIPVMEPPDDYPKLRRHKNARYSFKPLEGAGQL